MKTLLLGLLLASHFPLPSHAEPLERPCSTSCTDKMKSIADDFDRGSAPDMASLPAVFSGGCYHLSSSYNPDHEHFGYTLLDPKDGNLYTSGTFAFFYKENPYSAYTVDEARSKQPDLYNDNRKMEVNRDYLFIDMNPKRLDMPWKYWMKEKDGNLIVIGQWGHYHRLYCRFPKNP